MPGPVHPLIDGEVHRSSGSCLACQFDFIIICSPCYNCWHWLRSVLCSFIFDFACILHCICIIYALDMVSRILNTWIWSGFHRFAYLNLAIAFLANLILIVIHGPHYNCWPWLRAPCMVAHLSRRQRMGCRHTQLSSAVRGWMQSGNGVIYIYIYIYIYIDIHQKNVLHSCIIYIHIFVFLYGEKGYRPILVSENPSKHSFQDLASVRAQFPIV